jgi:hypothetical protein
MDEPSPEDVAAIAAFLDRQAKARSELEAHPYDGVRGLPPDWVHAPTIARFRNLRNRLIEDDGWTPEQLLGKLDTYALDPEQFPFPRTCPAGRKIDAFAFFDDVGFLASLRYAASLQPQKGLPLLAGKHAYQGYRQHEGSKQSRRDALRELMELALDQLRNRSSTSEPTWRDVIAALPDYDSDDEFKRTIQEIDDETEVIHWLDRRDKPKKTTFASFRDRLTQIRKSRR